MSPALIAGIGTVILSVVSRVVGAIPCIGWLLVVTLSLFGLGAIILTRVGTRDYPEVYPAQSVVMSKSVSPGPTAPSNNELVSEIHDGEDIK